MMINRVNIIVLDSFGVGELPDADKYGDCGSDTLGAIYRTTTLNIPNMKKLGLYNIQGVSVPEKEEYCIGSFGKCAEKCAGKNSPVGHWEISGYVKEEPFSTYPNAFPQELLDEISKRANLPGFCCNKVGSGTELLKQYGEEIIATGKPMVYTSADSVFQIAAHEDYISVDRLYEICQISRDVIDEMGYNIGTVIARPFVGDSPENYKRTYNRKDFEATSFGRTMLDVFSDNGKKVLAIGKIQDLFTGRGISRYIHTNGNTDGIARNIEALKTAEEDMIFTNLVDYDMLYGHRNDPEGYARALEEFDGKLPEIMEAMREGDMLIITADHGCDPVTPSTDHSREYIPLLIYGKGIKQNVDLGIRDTYADISATILDIFGFEKLQYGTSFKDMII